MVQWGSNSFAQQNGLGCRRGLRPRVFRHAVELFRSLEDKRAVGDRAYSQIPLAKLAAATMAGYLLQSGRATETPRCFRHLRGLENWA